MALGKGAWIALAIVLLAVGSKTIPKRRGASGSRDAMKWTDQEMRTFIAEVGPTGVPLAAALNVYTAESGLDPKASSGIAFGICQLTQIAAKQIGWTRPLREFGQLTLAQQIPWVAKLIVSQIKMIGYTPKTALELYVANFSPKAAAARSERIYEAGTKAYERNASLDRDHKGYIAASDLQVSLNRAKSSQTYKDAIAQLERLSNG